MTTNTTASSVLSASSSSAWPFVTHADSTITVRFYGPNSSNSIESPGLLAVGYWSIRGLAAPIRMMLCAAQQDHIVYLYDCLECDDDSTEKPWSVRYLETEKARLRDTYGNPFMNLPYIVDPQRELLLTQSNACLQYVGECLHMMGGTNVPRQRAICLQLLCELYDLRDVMANYAYADPTPTTTREAAAAACVAAARAYWTKFEQHLLDQQLQQPQSRSCFLVGDKFSAPDFCLFEMVDQFDQLGRSQELPDCLADFPHVRAFQTAFAELPYVL